MATKSYKQMETSGMKAEEPVIAYQQAPYTQTDSGQKLIMRSEVDKILDASSEQDSFEERYRKAKEFAYKHFDPEYIQSLEARNFLVDEPFPAEICETKEDLERIIAESEASGECAQEEVDNMYARWESIL